MSSAKVIVLVAEDDPFQRELILSQLRASGFTAIVAQSGEQALSLLLSGQEPDVLVTDICMPGTLDGWALAERCRSLYPRLLVIYTTSGPRDAVRQVENSLFIPKPYHPGSVIVAIQQTMRDRQGASRVLPSNPVAH